MTMKRITENNRQIYPVYDKKEPFGIKPLWNAYWVTHPSLCKNSVIRYTLNVNLPSETSIRISASDRYIIFCDGIRTGRGPSIGTHNVCYYDSYSISAGYHELMVIVYSQEQFKPWCQINRGNRFILDADKNYELLATGYAPWKAAVDKRFSFTRCVSPQNGTSSLGTGGRIIFDARAAVEKSADVYKLEQGYCYNEYDIQLSKLQLIRNPLPPMHEKKILLDLQTTVLPNTQWQKIIPLDNYYCAYPFLNISGGKNARITLEFSEALYELGSDIKNKRNEYIEKEFRGIGDTYIANGDKDTILTPLHWLSGRYIRISIKTYDEPLLINSLYILETHYPLKISKPLPNKGLIGKLTPILLRTLLMCMHDTYMDCPHYEQLMYIGDTRIQMLINYALSNDTRLAEHSIEILASSFFNGTMPCCYPASHTRVIPGFALYFVAIIHDYAIHTGNTDFIKPYLNVARSILSHYLPSCDDISKTPDGWNFYDWVNGWKYGIPPEHNGICFEFNAHLIYTLMLHAKTERLCGECEFAEKFENRAQEIKNAILKKADNNNISDHYMCFMLLSGALDKSSEKRMLDDLLISDKKTLSVYFSHYLFEVYRKFGLYEEMDKYLENWRILFKYGFYTVPEEFSIHTRSDCHAWGAHPLYHYIMLNKKGE